MKWSVYHCGKKIEEYVTFDEASFTMKMICDEYYGNDFPEDGVLFIRKEK